MYIGLTNLGLNSTQSINGAAVANDWAARVVSNGGTVSSPTQTAVSTFVNSCITAGIWGRFLRLNLFCGNQLAACLVPLVVGGGTATDTNTAFVAGDYTEATGLTSDGLTKYLFTGLDPSAINGYSKQNAHLAAYCRTGAFSGALIGTRNGGPASRFNINPSSNTAEGFQDAGVAASAGTTVAGHQIYTSAGATMARYLNGIAGNADTSGTVFAPTHQIPIFGCNSTSPTGPASALSAVTLAGYSIGFGLSASESAAYYTALQTFQTTLGRQV